MSTPETDEDGVLLYEYAPDVWVRMETMFAAGGEVTTDPRECVSAIGPLPNGDDLWVVLYREDGKLLRPEKVEQS